MLESGWLREWAISLATSLQIPVLVSSPIDDDLPRVASALMNQEAEGAMVVPGTLLRATPAALRLRELVATKLGPILDLKVELPAGTMHDAQVISVIDWCRWLLGSSVSQIERLATASGLVGESKITWRTELESAEESLETDRPAEQVLLDLFLRRVVGGVVPVPSWADLHAACQLWHSAR